MQDVLGYTQSLIRERIRELGRLDQRRKALPRSEYLSCRRTLLQAIEELRGILPMIEFELGWARALTPACLGPAPASHPRRKNKLADPLNFFAGPPMCSDRGHYGKKVCGATQWKVFPRDQSANGRAVPPMACCAKIRSFDTATLPQDCAAAVRIHRCQTTGECDGNGNWGFPYAHAAWAVGRLVYR